MSGQEPTNPKRKHQAYWAERFRKLEQVEYEANMVYFTELKKQYAIAAQNADKELAAWYQRFADAEGISLAQAKKKLDKNELKAFRMNVEEYVQKGKTLKYTDEWVKELERASTRVHIDRLEALKLQLKQQVETVYAHEEKSFKGAMHGVYEGRFYQTAFEIQKGVGIGWDFAKIDQNRIDKILAKPWAADGLNFSERIWRDRRKLMQELPTILTQAAIRGDGYAQTSKLLAKRFGVAESRAANLVVTESAFFASAGQRDCFEALDIEQYEVVATLDMKTSAVCRGMDGKYFLIGDFAPGITAPPFHGRCRSITCPYFDDEFEYGSERAARDPESGETYYVPASTTYPDWYEAFVNGGNRGDFRSPAFIRPMNIEDFEEKRIEAYIQSEILRLPDEHLNILQDYIKAFKIIDTGYSCFDRNAQILYLKDRAVKGELIHELAHALETKLKIYEDAEYIQIRNKGLEETSVFQKKYGKSFDYIEHDKFISKYQGAVYKTDGSGNSFRTKDGYINLNCLAEYFTEGYREYFINFQNLKIHDPELFEFIERLIKNER